MIVRRFKNGNYAAKAEPSDFDQEGLLIHLLWALGDKDCSLFGEEYCLSNYEMACDVYDCYNDTLVRIPYGVLADLEAGKAIRLYARKLSDDEREEYKELEELGAL